MVAIRLARFGRKKGAFYRIIAVDSTKKTAGANLEVLGYWNPAKKDLKIEREKLMAWVKKGAQLSATVKKLVEK
ncbi:MAG TPA: 30S ribosomal protein S16 [Patescibacteria group bacterium]|nr:30S ribosomal protein S16 [Patescibacteria group bacterium]